MPFFNIRKQTFHNRQITFHLTLHQIIIPVAADLI